MKLRAVTPEELAPFLLQKVVLLKRDGTERKGRLSDTPQAGLYNVEPDPIPDIGVQMSIVEDLWSDDIVSIRRAPLES
jgi:hypothetical protein